MADTFPNCDTCPNLDSRCVHRQQYLALEEYIHGLCLAIDIFDRSKLDPENYWLAGQTPDYKIIWIWRSACRLYGWAMLTSVLIHEFGHFVLFEKEGMGGGTLEAERKANQYGFESVRDQFIPEHYWYYRDFFLQSYLETRIWDEAYCIDRYQQWLKRMLT